MFQSWVYTMTSSRLMLLSFLLWLGTLSQTLAQLPSARLLSVFPAGGEQGSTFELTVPDRIWMS